MDDLYSAVEDVKLMNAMTDEPHPTKPWTLPSPVQIKEYVQQEESLDPSAFEPNGICSNSLGFYLYLRHIAEKGDQIYANFLMDVAKYKRLAWRLNRLEQAIHIDNSFLKEKSNDDSSPQRAKIPVDLFRNAMDSTSRESASITQENFSQFIEADKNLPTFIKFIGSPSEKVLVALENSSSSTPAAALEKALSRNLFDELELIVFFSMRMKHFESFQKSSYYNQYLSYMTMSVSHVSQENFLLFRVLGRGGFGIVYGCKKCESGHLYALKVMDRKRIKKRRAENLCITERNLMTILDSQFIVGLKYAYETPTEVHLVLGIMTGGDLGYHLRRKGIFNKLETKYYICRTILGLKVLHSYNIIFRDLKPDNILMDGRGRTALSDLGLAVVLPRNGITGACGTRGYWAPEMLRRNSDGSRFRYNLSVDWFSLGCVLYQFMSGINPFRRMGDTLRRDAAAEGNEISREEAIDQAVREMEPFYSPEMFTDNAIDLISKLLKKDAKTRLGAKGADEVMSHPFFKDVNWEEYEDDTVKPPCLPRKDLNYATQSEIGGFLPEENEKDEPLTTADRETFSHWNYIRPTALLEEAVRFMQHEEELGPIQIRTDSSMCCSIS